VLECFSRLPWARLGVEAEERAGNPYLLLGWGALARSGYATPSPIANCPRGAELSKSHGSNASQGKQLNIRTTQAPSSQKGGGGGTVSGDL